LGPRKIFDRWLFSFEQLKFAIKRGENIPREARSDSSDVLELPILESTKEERAKIFPRTRRRGMTQNDEFVLLANIGRTRNGIFCFPANEMPKIAATLWI
jgi:hypothetical protein